MNHTQVSRLSRAAAALLLLGGVALAPAAADARAGHGFSMGSRGSRTFSMPAPTRSAPYGASPFSRTMTPQGMPRASAFGGGMIGRSGHPLAAGLLGGFLGAGLAGMMFGHGFMHGGLGFGGLLGILLQLALIYFAVRWLMRRFSGAPAASLARGASGASPGYAQPNPRMQAGWAGSTPPLAISQADYGQFERSLRGVQDAWTRSDIGGLQRLATPEMVNTFAQQLQEQSSRGVHNAVSDVRLDRGDLSEAWSESGRDYATVAMRYSMIDITTDAAGRVVDGSPSERVSVAEFWTFVRTPASGWILSAIQQSR